MDDYVFGLDVAVDDAERVDLVDRIADLLDDGGHLGLLHGFGALELVEKLPASAHLQDDEDVRLIIEVAVHLDDIGVVEVELDLHLPDELLHDLLLLNQPLLDHLQRADETRVPLCKRSRTYCTSDTCPYFPEPSSLIFLKSLAVTARRFPSDPLLQISLFPVELPSNLATGGCSLYSFCAPLRCLKN